MTEEKAQLSLFDFDPQRIEQVLLKPLRHRIWTENKARLVERYLNYFLFITHHGTYIDGFAGPQYRDLSGSWAAELVVEMRPRWLRNIYLCELNPIGVAALRAMVERQTPREKREPVRTCKVIPGDFNLSVTRILNSGRITDTEATFCLLDQRTFECQWETVRRLALHKKQGTKIELFYFLGTKWLHRAASELKDPSAIEAWWGRPGWEALLDASVQSICDAVRERFQKELGYKHVHPWPIFEAATGNGVMYYMIQASDHDQAPILMRRAYEKALAGRETADQLKFDFERGDYLGEGV
jgi:three-Cys-motif partner protein